MTWNELRESPIVHREFVTWSPTGRARSVPYKVESINESRIVFVPRSGVPRNLPRTAAETFMKEWGNYRDGHVGREPFHDRNFNLSYLAGILKALDGNAKPVEQSTSH